MVDTKYANAYYEVLEILKYISLEDYNKIPKNKIKLFEINANKEYNFTYNPSKTLYEQNVSKTTKYIIAILFRDYWATEEQKRKIIANQNYNRYKEEERKKEKYNPYNIFENCKKNEAIKMNVSNGLTLLKKEIWYRKIFRKIKAFFTKH